MSRSLFGALALFAIGCGALYLIFAPGDEIALLVGVDVDDEQQEESTLDRALAGLEVAQRARQALSGDNYGVADAELRRLERLLTDMVAELAGPAAERPEKHSRLENP